LLHLRPVFLNRVGHFLGLYPIEWLKRTRGLVGFRRTAMPPTRRTGRNDTSSKDDIGELMVGPPGPLRHRNTAARSSGLRLNRRAASRRGYRQVRRRQRRTVGGCWSWNSCRSGLSPHWTLLIRKCGSVMRSQLSTWRFPLVVSRAVALRSISRPHSPPVKLAPKNIPTRYSGSCGKPTLLSAPARTDDAIGWRHPPTRRSRTHPLMSVNSTFVLLTPGEFRTQGDDTLAMGMGNRIQSKESRAWHELAAPRRRSRNLSVFNILWFAQNPLRPSPLYQRAPLRYFFAGAGRKCLCRSDSRSPLILFPISR